MKKKPTVISTFAGCGGSSLGYHMAGYRELLAIEWEHIAVQTFEKNFKVPMWERDVANVTGKSILEFCKIKKGELDVLDGSPPCQGFSTAGKRKVADMRNDLFKEYVRLIVELQPKVFVMENVSGQAKGKMKGMFLEILRTLRDTGYVVKVKQMNAKYYDVPQSRERLIYIGVRPDLKKEPSFPIPNKRTISARDALQGIEVKMSDVPKFNDKYAKLWPRLKWGQNAAHLIGKGQNSCVKINPYKPSPTLPKMQTGRGFATIAHWNESRALSIAEAKRLCSFPDDFELIGNYSEQWGRLGNAVMPNMMKAIATTIKEKIL